MIMIKVDLFNDMMVMIDWKWKQTYTTSTMQSYEPKNKAKMFDYSLISFMLFAMWFDWQGC